MSCKRKPQKIDSEIKIEPQCRVVSKRKEPCTARVEFDCRLKSTACDSKKKCDSYDYPKGCYSSSSDSEDYPWKQVGRGATNVAIGYRSSGPQVPQDSQTDRLQDELRRMKETARSEAERHESELRRIQEKNETLLKEAELAKQRVLLMEMPSEKEVAPLCKVCTVTPAEMLLEACGHIGTCAECTPNLQTCPICRTAITTTRRVFVVT